MREPSLEYQILRPDGSADELEVKVEVASRDSAVREAARTQAVAGFQSELGVRASVVVLDRDSIPRAGYKATRVIDRD
jgi:phenylacetate-coenzyme A ligase PaaK-like adenylate-forming protein